MSKRRVPGEIVKRSPGSGFMGSAEPLFIKVPNEPIFTDEQCSCMLDCGDDYCREWANLLIADSPDGGFIFHVSECQMSDLEMSDFGLEK